ncbi:hypothetical protein FOXB_15906 [Fusarium oxysporum f. sp. conglutinans Fo5176]|uniref:Uncharacterized protein n=1 Tax=Fusarium oxysporum (strain Fo5176) TaxID=660025 RepID=F9GB73_FUSOF|nr:hypothetical protein FOXB_15906 [Fusarium oxysporum f. sp. conglutinans Fo5176]
MSNSLGVKIRAAFGAIVFLVAIMAFLLIDIYHRARRTYREVAYHRNLQNFLYWITSGLQPYNQFADRDESNRGYYYHWRVGTMLRIHLEDAVTTGLYTFLFLILFLLFGVWIIQYWIARWLFG